MRLFWAVNGSGDAIGKLTSKSTDEVYLTPSSVDRLGLSEKDRDFRIRSDGLHKRSTSLFPNTELVSCVSETPFCPKSALLDQIGKLDLLGIDVRIGLELEFYLFPSSGKKDRDPPGVHAYKLDRQFEVSETISDFLANAEELQLGVETFHAEGGVHQFEVSFTATDPYSAAANLVISKAILSVIARKHQLKIDFSPKPSVGQFGSGLHVNFSVSENWLPNASNPECSKKFANGVISWCNRCQLIYCPSVGSYDRLHDEGMKNTWLELAAGVSDETRNAAIRHVKRDQRFEFRIPDNTANVYSILTSLIASGVHGITFYKGANKMSGTIKLSNTFEEACKRYNEADLSALNWSLITKRGLAQLL